MTADEDMREDHVQGRARPDAARRQWDAWLAEHDARIRTAAHSDLTVYSEAVTVESDEPTDAEVEAAYAAFKAHDGPERELNEYHERCCIECGDAMTWPGKKPDRRNVLHGMRAALTAAKGARR